MKLYRYLILTIALALVAAGLPTIAGAAPAGKLATYTHPDGLWSVQYPSDLLHPEQLNAEVVIFISKDRHTIAALDTLLAKADAYGGGSASQRRDTRARNRRILSCLFSPLVDHDHCASDCLGFGQALHL